MEARYTFGWILQRTDKDYVSHWWSQDWQVHQEENRIVISGKLFPHIEHESTPLKHVILCRLLAGYHLIGWLKALLIFKGREHPDFLPTSHYRGRWFSSRRGSDRRNCPFQITFTELPALANDM